ncbi:uncharacterized protein gp1ba isoform X2 [Salminus brasiliensis]
MSSGCQSDRNTDHRPRVSCVGRGLTAVPDGIDDGTQVLVLSQNQFGSLSWAAYSRYTQLHELDLSQNHIKVIDPSGPELQNLRVLRLSNNRLEGLGGRVFRFAPVLMEVYLDGNDLRTLHDATFGDLPQLEVINLSGNKLPALPRRLLEAITSTSLKTFDLEDNRVQHLPDEFFSSKPELPYVYLSQNPWLCSCQVGYLQQYLDDQGHNVYKHTTSVRGTESTLNDASGRLPGDRDMKVSITNDPDSVVCAGPPALKGMSIVDLQEDQYCSINTPLLHDLETPSTPSTTQPTTAPESRTTVSATETEATTVSTPPTASATATPTGGGSVQAFTTPSIWTRLETWTLRQVWTDWIPQSRTLKDIATARSELSRLRTSKALSMSIIDPGTSLIPVTWTFPQTVGPQPTFSTSHQKTSTAPPTSTLDPGTSPHWTSSQATTPLSTSSTSLLRTSRAPSSGVPGPETSIPFYRASGASRSVSGCGVPWCWWLFAGFLPLCILSALCSCMLFLWILVTYATLYRPIQRRVHKQEDEGVTLLTFQTDLEGMGGSGAESEAVVFLPAEKIPIKSQAVFRSVLFIAKEDEEAEGGGRREGVRGEDGVKIELVPAVEEERTGVMLRQEKERDRPGMERQDVFRKTLYRMISREEEIEGWREVEESWGPAERQTGDRGVERGKKRYSLILREDGGSVLDRDEGMEWLVGEWEGGGGLTRGSWGSLIRRIEGGASITPPSRAESKSDGEEAIPVGVHRATQNASRAIPEEGVALAKGGGAKAEGGGATALEDGAIPEVGGVVPGGDVIMFEGGGVTSV